MTIYTNYGTNLLIYRQHKKEIPMKIRSMVLTSLFAALIAAGAYISIPLAPVPITLQTLFIITAGLLGGKRIGLSAVAVYLAAGAAGLPVFSGGTGGIAHLVGPTGGFLFGSLISVLIAGTFSDISTGLTEDTRKATILLFLGAFLAAAAVYIPGLPWLKAATGLTWAKTFSVGMIPFIPGDLLKAAAAAAVARIFYERITEFLSEG